ncbi:MAG: hypothetical protein ACK4SS_08570, partial [Cypionkella sp.]
AARAPFVPEAPLDVAARALTALIAALAGPDAWAGPDGEAAALKLWQKAGVRVLPGAYLSRDVGGDNPGLGYIRVALVGSYDETKAGLTALRECIYGVE